ncbi:unnamed protein product [Merluccius merluccius]
MPGMSSPGERLIVRGVSAFTRGSSAVPLTSSLSAEPLQTGSHVFLFQEPHCTNPPAPLPLHISTPPTTRPASPSAPCGSSGEAMGLCLVLWVSGSPLFSGSLWSLARLSQPDKVMWRPGS